MITQHDLDEAILECQGRKNPDSNTCIKLAAFLIIKEHLYPPMEKTISENTIPDTGYSYQAGDGVIYTGDSEFAKAVEGKSQIDVFAVMDELMETLKAMNPRLYASVMRRLQ